MVLSAGELASQLNVSGMGRENEEARSGLIAGKKKAMDESAR